MPRRPATVSGWALVGALVWALVGSAGCSRGEPTSPEATVRALMVSLHAAQSDPRARTRVYSLLSARSQEALQRRAQLSSQMSGITLEPWEMLAPGRVRMRVTFDTATTTMARVQGDAGMVTVRDRYGSSAEVPVVREGGRWRVELGVPEFTPQASRGD